MKTRIVLLYWISILHAGAADAATDSVLSAPPNLRASLSPVAALCLASSIARAISETLADAFSIVASAHGIFQR